MGEQQKEALSIISKIKNDFNQNSPDLKLIFRQALLAYQILGSDMEYNWFYSELNGYPAGSTSPEYRKIEGVFKWHYDSNGFYEGASISSALETYGWPRFIASEVPQKTTIDIYTPIDWILQAASSGYLERTDEVRKIYFGHAQIGEIIFRRYRNFESNSFKNCLREIERNAYDRITHTYVSLKYGNAIQSIWDEYRIAVDRKLSTLGFDGHLKEIEKGITSTNPASWQSAMYACRNLTSNIANYLWRDPRPTYDLLPGQGPNEKLQVTEDKFANRLSAYLHQKGLTRTSGKFIRDEFSRLATSFRSLIEFQSKAHASVTREETLTVALATYFLLGEIVLKTDLEPIVNYESSVS